MKYFRVLAIAIVLCVAQPAPSQAGLLDLLFPTTKRDGPDPAKTLRAPFANDDVVIDAVDIDAAGSPLHTRHRTNQVMTFWVRDAVSSLLSYGASDYNAQFRDKSDYLSGDARLEYIAFMRDEGYVNALQTGRFNITGVLQAEPILVNEGAVDNRYRWLYQGDVLVTFLPREAEGYDSVSANDTVSKTYTLTFQVGRSTEAQNEHGIFIETWAVTPRRD